MKKFVVPLLILLVVLMASCTYPSYSPFGFWFGSSTGNSRTGAYVYLNFENEVQSSSFISNISSYTLIIKGPKETIQENNVAKDTNMLKYYLTRGKYDIKIIAHSPNGQALGVFEQSIDVTDRKEKNITVAFSEIATLVLELPTANNNSELSSRAINSKTNAWSIFIRNISTASSGDEYAGTTYEFKKIIVGSDQSPSEKVSVKLAGSQKYSIELYSQSNTYNPSDGNVNFDNSTTTFDYGSKIVELASGESTTVYITMNPITTVVNQPSIDITKDKTQPSVFISFPEDYINNRFTNTGHQSGINGGDFSSMSWNYITKNSNSATSVTVSSTYLDKATFDATMTGTSLPVNTFSSTGTIYYWFEATDVNGVKLIFPNEGYASFERTDGTGVSIVPQ